MHIYHYSAKLKNKIVDGLYKTNHKILNIDGYNVLKDEIDNKIRDLDNRFSTEQVEVLSLSYLGEVNN